MRLILFTFVMAFTLGFAISDSVEFFDAYAQEGDSELSSRASSADKEKLKKSILYRLGLGRSCDEDLPGTERKTTSLSKRKNSNQIWV